MPGPIGKSGRKPKPPKAPRKLRGFELQEATIADIHKVLKNGGLTCERLIELYLARVAKYSGPCAAYLEADGSPKPPDLVMPSGKGVQLGTLTPIAGAGQINAFANLNSRGQR